ncbi:MAG: hypothetical protein EON54_00115 [Alcaligenaceae bacterium]|nr:MAG: hypothetical protein EON54_00115 [Alcaligenaceae bacterium]
MQRGGLLRRPTTPISSLAGTTDAVFTPDEQGLFWFRTVTLSHYPIPTDGPVGTLLNATHQHPYRPAHIHFIAQVDQHRPLTTHIFMPGSPYLDSDAVFAVKQSLVGDLDTADTGQTAQCGAKVGSLLATVDLVLAAAPSGAPMLSDPSTTQLRRCEWCSGTDSTLSENRWTS